MASGLVILITGGTDGIGKSAAIKMAKDKMNTIIIHGRNVQKCTIVVDEVKLKSGNRNIFSAIADFANLATIKPFIEDINSRFPKLNVLLLNAGVLSADRVETVDNNMELTFQVNHVGYFATAHHLLPLLRSNTPSRIVVTSSMGYSGHQIDWDDLHCKHTDYDKFLTYCRSKLMNLLFAMELAKRIDGSGVTCNVLEPGVIDTKLLAVGGFSGDPVDQGSITQVHLCMSPTLEGINGKYFDRRGKEEIVNSKFVNDTDGKRLWELTEDILKQHGLF